MSIIITNIILIIYNFDDAINCTAKFKLANTCKTIGNGHRLAKNLLAMNSPILKLTKKKKKLYNCTKGNIGFFKLSI